MALTGGAYVATYAVTDIVNASPSTAFTIAANQNLALNDKGFQQGALYELLNTIATNWNLCMTAVEADGATTTTYTPDNALTALASQGNGITKNGIHQKDLVAQLSEMETKFNAVLALLDADGGVTLTTYTAVAAAAGTGATLNLDDTVVGSLGLNQDAMVGFLEDFVDKMNAILANMDVDNA